jgi:phosphoglycerate dehydrogenase-like enzyme
MLETLKSPATSIQKPPRPKGVFIGLPGRIAAAYGPESRREIDRLLDIQGPDIVGDHWENRRRQLAHARVIMSTWGMPSLTPDFLDAAPKLQAVFYAAGSVRGFATDAAYDRGITISSARLINAVPVAEYAASVITLSLKRFWEYASQTRNTCRWQRNLPVPGAYGSTIGLVSLGATGRLTAERLSRLDCRLIAFDPMVTEPAAAALGVNLVSLEDVFRLSDVVSIHAPLLPETRGMIDARLLGLMKRGATLINTSRGACVVGSDLCEILQQRSDLTAVLDVTDPEPPDVGSPLFRLPNVVMTPHISGSMGQEIARMGCCMVEELTRFLANAPMSHSIGRELLLELA